MKKNELSIFQSFGYLTVGTILGKASGFLKHYLIVYYFSITQYSDSFFIANMIPELVVNILISGLLAGAFIPLAGEVLTKKGKKYFSDFVSSIFIIIGIICFFIGVIIFIFPRFFAFLLAPDYGNEQLFIIGRLLQYFTPGILFLGLAAILSGILQSLEDFRIVSFGLFIYNIIFFISLIVLKNTYQIYAAGIGISLGAFFWFISHYFFTLRYIKLKITITFIYGYIKKTAKLALPSFLIIFFSNLILILEKNLASGFEVGTISELNLAFRLTNFFLVILILPLSTVLLPRLSKYFSTGQKNNIIETIRSVIEIITFVLVFVLMLVVFNTTLITKIIYYSLNIKTQDFYAISKYALMYSLAFIGLFYYMFLIRVFYASQKVWEVVKANIIGFISYVITYILFMKALGSMIFPLAYTIYAIVTTIYLFIYLNKKMFKPMNAFYWNTSFYLFNIFFLVLLSIFKYYFFPIGTIGNLIFSLIFLILYILTLKKFRLINLKILKKT